MAVYPKPQNPPQYHAPNIFQPNFSSSQTASFVTDTTKVEEAGGVENATADETKGTEEITVEEELGEVETSSVSEEEIEIEIETEEIEESDESQANS